MDYLTWLLRTSAFEKVSRHDFQKVLDDEASLASKPNPQVKARTTCDFSGIEFHSCPTQF